jgi:hypothetical protein
VVGLDPLPEGAPVVIRYRVPDPPGSPAAIVDDVLNRMEVVARELFPAWLPDAGVLTDSSDFDRRMVRQLARRLASTTDHFGPFLADLAEAALRGTVAERRFELETRARGLSRIVADAYGRDAIVLLVGPADEFSDDEQRCFATACEWLADHGGFGSWLVDGALPDVDRFPTWLLTVPDFVEALSPSQSVDAESRPAIEYPALAGLPHPGSIVEQTLARHLALCEWAAGGVWNQRYESHSLAPAIRVDLLWRAERVVVEMDGPDHRERTKYAADRRRDNGLTLDGYAVLRFTNEDIVDDPQRVLGVIEQMLTKKRTTKGSRSETRTR